MRSFKIIKNLFSELSLSESDLTGLVTQTSKHEKIIQSFSELAAFSIFPGLFGDR